MGTDNPTLLENQFVHSLDSFLFWTNIVTSEIGLKRNYYYLFTTKYSTLGEEWETKMGKLIYELEYIKKSVIDFKSLTDSHIINWFSWKVLFVSLNNMLRRKSISFLSLNSAYCSLD